MKTEEPNHAPRRESEPGARAGSGDGRNSNGVAHARPVETDASPHGGVASIDEIPAPKRSRVLKLVYWVVWFGILPTVFASIVIWLLSPSSGAEPSGALAWAQSTVRSQPVPVGIVLFTLFEIALWAVRHELPFSQHAHPPQRGDIPPRLRVTFERARSLLDEAETILAKHRSAISRDLAAKERDRLRVDLEALRASMERVPFDEQEFMDALTRTDGEVDIRLGRWRKSEVREYLEAILMAVAVALGLRAVVIEAFKIPSGSMIPTLMVGDHIFVNKFSYGPAVPFTHVRLWTNMPPRRGDVMVFAFPEHPEQDFIKRVIALEGDKLEARNGHPILNGWEVPSCRVGSWSYNDFDSSITRHEGDLFVEYLGDESYLTFYDRASGVFPDYQGPFFAKPGEVWVMGDNRNNSHDSRMWFGGQGGGVPYDNIKGRALFVWLSVSDNGIDWSREGAPVMGRPRLPPSAKALTSDFELCLKNRPAVTLPPPGPGGASVP